MVRKWAGSVLLALVAAVAGWIGACGTDAVGVETCRQIEEARCQQAPNCPDINLSNPKHRDSPKTDVDACIRFYRDACLHGLQTPNDPGPNSPQTKACIDAINKGNCAVVEDPSKDPACAWLVPPAPPPATDASDAPADAPDAVSPASDAGTDALDLLDALLGI
jgi:hypothetical protein